MKRAALSLIALAALGALTLTGCSPSTTPPSGAGASGDAVPALRVGTLQTDDLLPLWVAEDQGMLQAAGLDVTITTFQSAQDQIAAVTAGQIDAIMTDMVVGAQLSAGGVPMRYVTLMQGAPAGVVAGAGTGITTAADLAGVETGCSSPTILEFIYDKALADAGVPADQIKTTEIKSLPVRLQMLTSGQIKAAALPWTLFQLAVAQGAVPVLGIDQVGSYTSTVFTVAEKWLDQPGATSAMTTLLAQWDKAVDVINADPGAQRALLASKANLPSPLDTTYQVRQYPPSGPPPVQQVTDVLTWMTAKGYLKAPLTAADLIWQA
ncbi:MAG: ABC transporter substrate-binding protein [Propionibacteriaceae bacterium]|nr:ABC transporter substrate-binding protein [Propionibacteriaceae bacterium]